MCQLGNKSTILFIVGPFKESQCKKKTSHRPTNISLLEVCLSVLRFIFHMSIYMPRVYSEEPNRSSVNFKLLEFILSIYIYIYIYVINHMKV